MAQRECEECKKVFTYSPPANFPDKRKYCDECSAAKKAAYEAGKGKPAQAASWNSPVTSTATIVREIKEKANSYEFGKAGARIKFYFETLTELKQLVQEAVDLMFVEDPRVIKID